MFLATGWKGTKSGFAKNDTEICPVVSLRGGLNGPAAQVYEGHRAAAVGASVAMKLVRYGFHTAA